MLLLRSRSIWTALVTLQQTRVTYGIAFGVTVFGNAVVAVGPTPQPLFNTEVQGYDHGFVEGVSLFSSWWILLPFFVALIAIVTLVWLSIGYLCRIQRRQAEDAVRVEDIEKSIRLMTARLYRTRQLWQARHGHTDQHRDPKDLSTGKSHCDPSRLHARQSSILPSRSPVRGVFSSSASDECGEVSPPTSPDPSALLPLHQQPPPPSYEHGVQRASMTAGYHSSVASGGGLSTRSRVDLLGSSPSPTTGLKRSMSKLSSATGSRPTPPTSSVQSTRVFSGLSKVGALRRALQSPQLLETSSTSPLGPAQVPTRPLTLFRSAASRQAEESQLHRPFSLFHFPADLRSESKVSANDVVHDAGVVKAVEGHSGEGSAHTSLRAIGVCFEEGGGALEPRTDIAEAGSHANASPKEKEAHERKSVTLSGRFKAPEECLACPPERAFEHPLQLTSEDAVHPGGGLYVPSSTYDESVTRVASNQQFLCPGREQCVMPTPQIPCASSLPLPIAEVNGVNTSEGRSLDDMDAYLRMVERQFAEPL